jgi:hypothetical protein
MRERTKWWLVVSYAAAMAWVEAATVVYLRTLTGRLDPHQPSPMVDAAGMGFTEVVREIATLIMLLTIGGVAGRTWRSRLGYAVVAFGVWDILYYVFMKVICGWPKSLLTWDILFLLPLPWWGPVLAPILIAGLMVLGGTLVSQNDSPEGPFWPSRRSAWFALFGALLALYVFMADALRVMGQGERAIRSVLPSSFNWLVFMPAIILISAPVVELGLRRLQARK